MPDISTIIQHGATTPWLYLPAAVLLGALHALEPGHSKSLMAAFIIAVRGTPWQATLLGISAAVGHTIIVWGLALLGLYLGDKLILDQAEPWLLLLSGILIIGLAARLLLAVNRHTHAHHVHDSHEQHHEHDLDHDTHAAEHARDIRQKFSNRSSVGNGEVAWFGFTGGLLPCPTAIAVLLVCLQLKAFTLGVAMVAAFSIGLAITLVGIGLAAAWGTRRAQRHWSGFDTWSERLPYISGTIVMTLGLLMILRSFWQLGWLGPH